RVPPVCASFVVFPIFLSFSCLCCRAHPDLHSFPTRRSSDLPLQLAEPLRRQHPGELHQEPGLRHHGRPPLHQLQLSPGFRLACPDRKSTRLNSSHVSISYAVFCLKKKKYIHHLITLY